MEMQKIFDKHGLVVIDNLVPEDEIDELRWYAINTPPDSNHKFRGGYVSVSMDDSFPLYNKLARRFIQEIPILRGKKFDRGWIYTYEHDCGGVTPHADPAAINVNLWVTPDHCIADPEKNGLIIYDKKHPDNWTWEDYNKDVPKIEKFLKDSGAKERHVKYKCNRLMAFNSSYFHKTNGVSTKPGDRNRRINVTFMYQ